MNIDEIMAKMKKNIKSYTLSTAVDVVKEILEENEGLIFHNYKDSYKTLCDGDNVYICKPFWFALSKSLNLNYSETKDILNDVFLILENKKFNCITI